MHTNHHHVGVKISQINASSRYSQVCFFGILATLAACGDDSFPTTASPARYTLDTTGPTVRFSESGSAPGNAEQVVYNVVFNEELLSAPSVTNFNVNNGTVTDISDGQNNSSYKITIVLDPELDDVEIKPTVTGFILDKTGNTLDTGSSPSYGDLFTADRKGPTATINTVGNTNSTGGNLYVVTFSENVTGVDTSSLTSDQGTISGISKAYADVYTVTITANNGVDGDLSLTLSDAIKDDAENTAESTPTLRSAHSFGTTAPTVIFSANESTAGNADEVVYDAIFSKAIALAFSPTPSDFSVNNGTVTGVSDVLSGNTYKVTIDLNSGLENVEIKPMVTGNLEDNAGNILDTAVSPTFDTLFIADSDAPTATINKVGETDNDGANIYEVKFSEDVTGVSTSSVTSRQGGISAITKVSASLYTVTITANNGVDGNLSLSLSDAIKDSANIGVESTPTLESAHSVDTVDPTLTRSVFNSVYYRKSSDGDTVTLSVDAIFDEMVDAEFVFSSGKLTANNDDDLKPSFTDNTSHYDSNGASTINNVKYATTWFFYFEIWDDSPSGQTWDEESASVDVDIDLIARDSSGNSKNYSYSDRTLFDEWNVSSGG